MTEKKRSVLHNSLPLLFSESSESYSEDRFSNSQSSKDGFTLNRSSGGSEQLDYNDTLTSGERTPKGLSPVNGQIQNAGTAFIQV